MRKSGVSDTALCAAVIEMAQGLMDADFGGRSPPDLNALVEEGVMQEICHDPETESEKPDS